MVDVGCPMEEGRSSVIPFGMYRTRMRIRSRTINNTANGQADTPLQATLIDLVGHVKPNANYREDGIVNFSEGAIDTIEIVIPYYEGILTGYLVEVYDSINNAQAITYYEIMSITDDRNKHQQLSLKCRVAERSILPAPSYSATIVTVGGGGGGGGTNNITTTNLLQRSSAVTTGPWFLNGTITNTVTGTAPDGVSSAQELAIVSQTFSSTSQSVAAGSNRTFSVYMRAGSSTSGAILIFNSTGGGLGTNPNSSAVIVSGPGTVARSIAAGASFVVSGLSPTLWTRVAVTRLDSHDIVQLNPVSVGTNLTGSTQFWGAQLETGSVATNFVPTTTASVTGYAPGGGGGGGGQLTSSVQTLMVGTPYVVTIGTGGAGAVGGSLQAANGTNTSFIGGVISQTSQGGGGGGSGLSLTYPAAGGGSGGGAGGTVGGTGGLGVGGGTAGGDSGATASPYRGGGGGGSNAQGTVGNAGLGTGGGGTGGFAGGGGGGSTDATGGTANGGGGAGGNSSSTGGTPGQANTGGGGGGAGNNQSNAGTSSSGGAGGSGVVTVAYAGSPTATFTGTMTTVTAGGITTHTLTSNGTLTP